MSLNQSQQDASNRIYTEAINAGMPDTLAQILVGQSGNETGGWTSDFFVNNNNCFGYSCSSVSIWQNGCSKAVADNGVTVGNYDSIEDSVNEIVDWIARRQKDGSFPADLSTITTPDQYATLLKNAGNPPGSMSYYGAPESQYTSNITLWLSRAKNFFKDAINGNPDSLVAIGLIVGLGVFFAIKKGLFKKLKL